MTIHDSAMESLPDEIWSQIFCISTKKEGGLGARDLCALAVVSKRARRISSESKVWRPLLERDFSSAYRPSEESEVDAKTLYRTKHEKEKVKREADRSRQIMRLQSSLHSSIVRMLKFEKKLENEKAAAAEVRRRLCALHTSSRASLALQRWQPEAVRTHHQRVLQQVPVDLTAEVNSLKLDLQERYHFIVTRENALESLEKSIKSYQQKLEELYNNRINPTGGTSSPVARIRKMYNIDWSSARQAKRANTMTQFPGGIKDPADFERRINMILGRCRKWTLHRNCGDCLGGDQGRRQDTDHRPRRLLKNMRQAAEDKASS